MLVLFGNIKGGVGKSTEAIQVAAARALQGRNVLVADGDRQGTSSKAIGVRMSAEIEPSIACVHYVNGPEYHTQIRHQAKLYDDVIMDCGGHDSQTLRYALGLADVVVVPFQPRPFDTWALEDISELIDQVQAARLDADRPPLRVICHLNSADPGINSQDNIEAEKVLEHFPQLPFVKAALVRRKAFPLSSAQGMCVFETMPATDKACDELKRLMNQIFQGN